MNIGRGPVYILRYILSEYILEAFYIKQNVISFIFEHLVSLLHILNEAYEYTCYTG